MNEIYIINNEQIIEGFVAGVTLPILILIFKQNHKNMFYYSMIAWFITWILRKFTINIYKKYRELYNVKDEYYSIKF